MPDYAPMSSQSLANYNAIIIDNLKIIEESEKIAQKACQDILFIEQENKHMPQTIEYLNSIYTSHINIKQLAQDNIVKCLEIIERIRQHRKKILRKRMFNEAKRQYRLMYGL
jgi:hypothetical protein